MQAADCSRLQCPADTHAARCRVLHHRRHGAQAYEDDSGQTRVDAEPGATLEEYNHVPAGTEDFAIYTETDTRGGDTSDPKPERVVDTLDVSLSRSRPAQHLAAPSS